MALVRTAVVLGVVAWAARSGTAAPGVRAERVNALQEAGAAFERGVHTTGHVQAAAHFRTAARKYEYLVEQGVRNGGLYYNLGNTYFWLGDIGRAILNYRRAERLTPAMAKLHSNLAYARHRVGGGVQKTETRTVVESILFWHYDWSPRTRSVVAALAYLAAWVVMGVRVFRRRRILTAMALVAWAVVGAMAVSIAVESRSHAQHPPGVVVAQQVEVRKGSGQTFVPAFDRALGAGTEFVVVERRGTWWEIELPNGQAGWIPAEAAELVYAPESG